LANINNKNVDALTNKKNTDEYILGEINILRYILDPDKTEYHAKNENISVKELLNNISKLLESYTSFHQKNLSVPNLKNDIIIKSDQILLLKVLQYMLTNAFEATSANQTVKLRIEDRESLLVFKVWNKEYIKEAIALRIFQKYFSTKEEMGRGFGTYSMKLIGERLLNGKVKFSTSETKGTSFSIALPKYSKS
jgi:sensor histidine kinase regulating citrate/malate metabolism